MKLAIIALFSIVVLAVASESVEENQEGEFLEQQRACAERKEKCTKDDDCSCCGKWDKCSCNWPGREGCFCMRGMMATRLWKMAKC
uniref:Toxin 24 isoform c n=1 Tax=Cupiennius salei TaxID=6928 RepID=A0A4Y5UHC6_CUPSA|nr:toxin 24 isoform c precursor [Cupiennius salei]